MTVAAVELACLNVACLAAIGDAGMLSADVRDDCRVGEDSNSDDGVTDDLRGDVWVGVPALALDGGLATGEEGL